MTTPPDNRPFEFAKEVFLYAESNSVREASIHYGLKLSCVYELVDRVNRAGLDLSPTQLSQIAQGEWTGTDLRILGPFLAKELLKVKNDLLVMKRGLDCSRKKRADRELYSPTLEGTEP